MAATRSIELKTAIPGPRSREILQRKERVVADALSVFLPVVISRGEGATLTDVDGNTFIDFTGGVGCLNVGHTNPHVVDAVQEQSVQFMHTDFTIVPYETYVTLAERLLALTPISGPAKAAFFNAGTEAVENSIKFARAFTKRPAVIAPLPLAHVEDASVQSRFRSLCAGGLSAAVRAGLPRSVGTGGARRARACARHDRRRRDGRGDRDRTRAR
jgi:glutamate-1-semialdehyde aminotransferase